MQVNVVGRRMTVQPEVEAHAEERFGKLNRYFNGVRKVEVVLTLEGHGQARQAVAEATLTLDPGNQLVGRGEGSEVIAAMDAAESKLEKQLRRLHARLKAHRDRTRIAVEEGGQAPAEAEEETYDQVVREMLEEGEEK